MDMDITGRKLSRLRRFVATGAMGTCLLWWPGGCDPGSITTTTTVTLDTEDIVTMIIKSTILTPLENWIDAGVEAFFDKFEDD
jgi:hypothetical protein